VQTDNLLQSHIECILLGISGFGHGQVKQTIGGVRHLSVLSAPHKKPPLSNLMVSPTAFSTCHLRLFGLLCQCLPISLIRPLASIRFNSSRCLTNCRSVPGFVQKTSLKHTIPVETTSPLKTLLDVAPLRTKQSQLSSKDN
jgi:hypothetical protein